MKLSDYVASFLADQGIRHVFAVSGGATLHLIHSVDSTPGITFVCPQHEQAGAMAADAYSRVVNNLGAAIATSGPGATNMITGACCSYYDSVPVMLITGQVATFRMRGDTGVRQIGFQETDAVDMFRSVTNYAVRVDDPSRIRYELEKAAYLARKGRPGPVLVDIPDDIQREKINPEELERFVPKDQKRPPDRLCAEVEQCLGLLARADRPVIIAGWGIRLSGAVREFVDFIEELGFPLVPTWAVADLLPADHPLLVGTFGTHGTRYANFAVQNADLVFSIGSRLDTKATGSPVTSFAREARKIVVDIDPCELGKFGKFGLGIDLLVEADAKDFLKAINQRIAGITKRDISAWVERIALWKKRYPICPPAYYQQEEVNPYVFVKALSRECLEGDVLFVDTGCAVAWMMQAFDFKVGQRLFHDCNNTAMGWALPASIGGCFALEKKPVICVTGDGSLQMNIQELVTVIKYRLPIKIFLLNNHGYSMIRQTQDQWLDSKYLASSEEGGLAFPDFVKVAEAYGYKTVDITRNQELREGIRDVLDNEGPVFCNVEIDQKHRVIPQVKFGRPNEDLDPLLSREEFVENMIVEPLEVSVR